MLTGPANYDAWWDASGGAPDYAGLGLAGVRERDITSVPAHNRWVDASLSLRPTCGGGPTGVYLLEVIAPQVQRQAAQRSLLNVTDLGLLTKVGNASSLVWVVRLSTGQPVADAVVKIRALDGRVKWSGKSNRDGVALAPGATKLIDVEPRADEDQQTFWEDYRARRVIVTAQAGDDLAVLDTNWNNGIQI